MTRTPSSASRSRLRTALVALLMLVAPLALLIAACDGSDDAPPADSDGSGGGLGLEAAGYPVFNDEETGLRTVLGTPDLGVGRQRVSFVLSDDQGLVRLPVTNVATFYLGEGSDAPGDGASEPVETALARFFEFPLGTRGLYAAELTFDRPGRWALEVTVPQPDGSDLATRIDFPVAEHPSAPAVGDAAPRSTNRTIADVESVHELSTGAEPDPALYEQTIAEALDESLPLVVVFASPGFCTNALCGPQAEVLSELRARYADRANFIHVDIYENPAEIRGDLDLAVRTPLLEEWGLRTDEWTFVIDADGHIASRFEAFVTEAELEEALLAVLEG